MTIEAWLNILGGPVLGLLGGAVAVGLAALRTAKKEGAKEVTDAKLKADLDAAFVKIKTLEATVAQHETAQVQDNMRFSTLETNLQEVKSDVKTILATMQKMEVEMAGYMATSPRPRRKVS